MRHQEKRCSRIVMTTEAKVLRDLRIQSGLTMRQAGALLGLSDTYISHIETGRMDPPTDEKLENILAIYGGMKRKSFNERIRLYKDKSNPSTELVDLLPRLQYREVMTLLAVAKTLLNPSEIIENK